MNSHFHVCINVSNFEKSLDFYTMLEFSAEGQMGLDSETIKMQYLAHPSGGVIELIDHKDGFHEKPPALLRHETPGLNHFGFHVNDLSKMRDKLREIGAEIVEDSVRGPYAYLFARGPDNELIGFAEVLEK